MTSVVLGIAAVLALALVYLRALGKQHSCPQCNGFDAFCTLCDGEGIVSPDQASEFYRQNQQ